MSNRSHNRSTPIEARYTAIENRNFLSPVGFKFQVGKIPGVDFYCQS